MRDLEDVVAPMKWGFLADGVVKLCDSFEAGKPLARSVQNTDLAQGAVDFLELILEGDRNLGRLNFPSGIDRVIESVELYNWAIRVSPKISIDRLRKVLLDIWYICKRWLREEILEEADVNQLKEFFFGIARITLGETARTLTC